jgi:hypothetical protein
MKHFVDDDPGYFTWLEAHAHGFVINCYRNPTPSYLVLHRATCPHIQKWEGRTSTAGDYGKACSEAREDLEAWVNIFDGTATTCRTCNPDHTEADKDPYDRDFNLSDFENLRDFASLAFRECNLGSRNDWFGHFLEGYTGMRARLFAVRHHFREIHAWTPHVRDTEEMDYHLASILFGMDSTIECCTYALNALGCAVAPAYFLDISVDKKLKDINPFNILGTPSKSPLSGYTAVFPDVQRYWQERRDLLVAIIEQHDVSKHRKATILDGWTYRNDPPDDMKVFLDGLSDYERQEYMPRANFILDAQVKTPNARIAAGKGMPFFYLGGTMEGFRAFIQKTGELAYRNANTHISLLHKDWFAVQDAEEVDRNAITK